MRDENKIASEIYREKFQELQNLMNRHWQINQVQPENIKLPALAAEIRRIAAVCEVWKRVATYNATSKYYQRGY